jgi:proline iminopeptidase
MRRNITDHEVFYETLGEGRPVLLMHGGPGLDHTVFRPWLDPLSDRAQLVFYDQYGGGRSERPRDLGAVTHETWVEEADALRERLGHEKVVLLGHSYGGFLALEYALAHGDRLDGLVLVCTAASLGYAGEAMAEAERRATPAQIKSIHALFGAEVPDDETLGRLWRAALPVYLGSYDPGMEERLLGDVKLGAAASNRGLGKLIGSFDVSGRLPEIDVSTLTIAGGRDWVCPPALAAEPLHTGLPDSELVVFEESGHFPFFEEPERFVEVVRRYLDGLG